ncbi:UBX domain-containing protein 1 [Angomonas deanei]|nr:UBX domain-containing protein 1 [Angomonas deanei]|eukprot:EPY39937.1 UBX domain-containing protein 1 [Angomonas deanei]
METDESKEFFAQMDRGVVPSSLAAQFPNSDIDVELNDFQKRKYVPPQRAAFQGDGRRLESGTGPAPSSVAVECPEGGEVEVDEGADDVTVVRIIGSKGEAKSFSLNASKHRVKDLYRLARKEEPDLGPFTLVVRSVPPKPLGEDAMEMTIEEANLKRAAISVRK